MKYLIPILTFILFLCGLSILFLSLYGYGPGFYTISLTIGTFIGLISMLINRKIGWTITFFISIGWLLKYFESASFLILYDIQNLGRWILVSIPIILSFSLFGLLYKARKNEKQETFKFATLPLALLIFLTIGILSFIRKPHTDEFNCWYYIEENKRDFRITFAISPDHKFETIIASQELKEIIKKEAIIDEFRDGYYCPETKVKVITRFKKIVGVKILGFRNTKIDKVVKFKNPFEIDINSIKGDMTILEPEFIYGD